MGMFDGWFGPSDTSNFNTWSGIQGQQANYLASGVDDPAALAGIQNQMGSYYGSTGANVAPTGGSGDASKWAAGLKELAGGLKGGGGLPSPGTPQRNPLPGGAGLHPGTAGSLGTLLQLLAQRALMYNQAAHQGAVPARVQGSQGLLGL